MDASIYDHSRFLSTRPGEFTSRGSYLLLQNRPPSVFVLTSLQSQSFACNRTRTGYGRDRSKRRIPHGPLIKLQTLVQRSVPGMRTVDIESWMNTRPSDLQSESYSGTLGSHQQTCKLHGGAKKLTELIPHACSSVSINRWI